MNKIAKNFSTLFGIGFVPFMPGSIASLFTVTLYYVFFDFFYFSNLLIFFVTIFVFSIKLIDIYSNDIKKHDSSEIVIDEFIGITFILLFYDFVKFTNDFIMFLIIFFLFRFFDIVKLFPASYIDKKMNNSLGVLLDDIIAGLYCVIILYIINAFI
tara:strand:+ start:49 stop:516 length:468 start_codon:yes stop_codon:yes gene_type:complete